MAERTYAWRPDTDAHLRFHLVYDDADPEAAHQCVEAWANDVPMEDPQRAYEDALAYNNAVNLTERGTVGRKIGADGRLELDFSAVPSRLHSAAKAHLNRRFGARVRHA